MDAMDEEGLSSDSSSEEDETITEDDGALDRLEMKIAAHPTDYSSHVTYIAALRRSGDIDRLRRARWALHQHYPLTASQWAQWVEEEAALGGEAALEICEKGVSLHPLPSLWGPLLRLRVAKDPQKAELHWETCLSHVGLHPGSWELWEGYREWAETQSREAARKVWLRWLQVPFPKLPERVTQYSQWEGQTSPQLPPGVEVAGKEWALREPFEAKLEENSWEAWDEYLTWEEAHGNPSRVVALYERCLGTDYRSGPLWNRYLQFLEQTLPQRVADVSARAVAMTPWDGSLWARRLRAIERAGTSGPSGTSKETLEKELEAEEGKALGAALGSGRDWLEVWEAAGQWRRRLHPDTLPTFLSTALPWWESYFPDSQELCDFRRFSAALLGRVVGDMEGARSQWENIVKREGRYAQYWLEYLSLERSHGSLEKCRSLWKRASHAVRDYPQSIGESWVQFEAEVGTLSQWDTAFSRLSLLRSKAEAERRVAEQPLPDSDANTNVSKSGKGAKGAKGAKRKLPPPANERAKRPKGESEEAKGSQVPKKGQAEAEGRTVFVVNFSYSWDEERLRELLRPFGEVESVRLVREGGHPKGYGYVDMRTPAAAREALVLHNQTVDGRTLKVVLSQPPPKPSARDSPLTVFVSHLPVDVDEDLLRGVFSACGSITGLRVVKERATGEPKGFAYIDFEDEEAVTKALALSGRKVKGSDIRVQRSKPLKKDETTPEPANDPKPKAYATPRPRATLVPRAMKVPSEQGKPVASNEEFRKKFLMK